MLLLLFFFCLQNSPILPTKLGVNWPFGSGEVQEDGGHLGFPTGTILVIFYVQVTRYFLPSLESNGLSVQENTFILNVQIGGRGGHLEF